MKIGILIAAHSNQEQLERLVSTLKRDFEIFIHLDKKCDIPIDFMIDKNVHIIKEHKVYWGSCNQIKATLSLLELAHKHACDYCILISGIDLPIKKNQTIISEIEKDPQAIYMDYLSLPRNDWNHRGGLDRIQLYYENLKNRERFSPYNLLWFVIRRFQRYLNLRRKLLNLSYYGGNNWINFSKEIVTYILEYLKIHPEYLSKFEHTLCGDEIFFHTLILNSPYASKVVNDSKRYIEYDSGGPENPRTLKMKDLYKIESSNAWFGRKFNDKVDNEVINVIYSKIESKN